MKLFQSDTPKEKKQASSAETGKTKRFVRVRTGVTGPHITEKTTAAKDSGNAYGFLVTPTATKPMIKHEIERMYKVKVTHVNVVRMPRKIRRLGRSQGYVSGYKKALVYLKKGDTISFA